MKWLIYLINVLGVLPVPAVPAFFAATAMSVSGAMEFGGSRSMIFFGHIVALGAVVYPFLYLNCVVGSLSSLSAGKTTVAFYYALGPFGLLLIMAILFISFFALMRLDEKRKKKR